MTIDNILKVRARVATTRRPLPPPAARPASGSEEPAAAADGVPPGRARDGASDEMRWDRIDHVRRLLRSGHYDADERLEELLGRLTAGLGPSAETRT